MSNTNNNRQSAWQTGNVKVTRFNHSKTKKNGLMGFACAYVDSLDVEIKNIPVFNNNGKISISPPAIPPCPETNNMWFRIIDFYSKHDQLIFEKKVLEALSVYLKENNMTCDLGSGVLMV